MLEPTMAEQSVPIHKIRGMGMVIKQLKRIADAFEEQNRINTRAVEQAQAHHVDAQAHFDRIEEQRHQQERERMQERFDLEMKAIEYQFKHARELEEYRRAVAEEAEKQAREQMYKSGGVHFTARSITDARAEERPATLHE